MPNRKNSKTGLFGNEWTAYQQSQQILQNGGNCNKAELLDEYSRLSHAFFRLLKQTERTTARIDDQQKKLIESLQQVKDYSSSLHKSQKKILSGIHFAYLIQSALLPDIKFLEKRIKDFFIIWQPRNIVGGDFFTFQENQKGYLFGIIDCTGHGVYGALMTMVVRALLEEISGQFDLSDPAAIMGEWNRRIRDVFSKDTKYTQEDAGLDACLIFMPADQKRCVYASAGIPVFGSFNGEITAMPIQRYSIGYRRSAPDYQYANYEVTKSQANELYITTDGYIDQLGEKSDMPLGKKKFIEFLQQTINQEIYQKVVNLHYRLNMHQGDLEQTDDITVTGFAL